MSSFSEVMSVVSTLTGSDIATVVFYSLDSVSTTEHLVRILYMVVIVVEDVLHFFYKINQ